MHDSSNQYTSHEDKSLFWVKRCIISDMILLWFLISLFTLIGLPAVLVLVSWPLGLLAPTVGFPQPRISNPWPFLDLYQKEVRGKQRP